MSTRKKTGSQEIQALLSRRYPVTFYPAEEGGYVAEIEDLPGCITQGETVDEAAAAIEECRVAWMETALANGMEVPPPRTEAEYSGRFLLRLPKSLHRRLAARARRDGVSLNTELATLLASALEVKEQQSRTKSIVRAMLNARAPEPTAAPSRPGWPN
jgi:antitoxin HicB